MILIKLHLYFLFSLMILDSALSHQQQVCNHQDQSSLLTFFNDTIQDSSPPLNWTTLVSCCQWEGVKCNINGRVTHLKLPSRGIKGISYFSLKKLVHLSHLNLSYNSLSGSLPNGLFGFMDSLEVIDLSHNHLSGDFSSSLAFEGHFSIKIHTVDVSNNQFEGTFDEYIFRLTNLRVLDLSFNSISGIIPSKIGGLLHLEKLHLNNNNLSGSIPSSLMKCTNLVEINFGTNFLVGEISKIDWSRLAQLQKLDFMNNSLTGILPESIYSCRSLVAYRVSFNNFSGQISPKIAELKSLSFLSLTANSFTNITKMLTTLANCQHLSFLSLAANFNGEALPSSKSFLAPTSFPNLKILTLLNCNLTGPFPQWLSHIKTLQWLGLGGNQFSGEIPNWLGALPSLFRLSLAKNNLSGKIPQELCHLPALMSGKRVSKLHRIHLELPLYSSTNAISSQGVYNEYKTMRTGLDLSYNKFSGNIPSEIGMLQGLQELFLNGNRLSGHIPNNISSLKNLLNLDLSENNLTGELPGSLKDLNFLAEFNVSYNDLQGEIPTGGQIDTFDKSSFEGNPRLCGEVLDRPCLSTLGSNPTVVPLNIQSDGKKKFLNGLYVGFASGFSGVLVIIASYFGSSFVYGYHRLLIKKR